MKTIILIILSSILGTKDKTKSLAGYWTGTGEQIDGKKWEVVLHIKDDSSIEISYPSFPCSGNWTFEKSAGNLYIFKEKIIEGADICDQGCEAHVQKMDKKRLKVTYYLRSYDPHRPIAEVFLQKKEKIK